jgi:uroporphyrinogen decarboxylase
MAYPTVLADVQTCVDLGVPSRVPIFALGEEFDVEQYDIDYRDYIISPEDMVACWVQAVETYDYDWVLLHPDDYIEFEPLGVATKTEQRVPPAAVRYPEATAQTLRGLAIPDADSAGRMPHHLAGLQGLKEVLGDEVVLAGRVAAPFSAVALLYGVEQALMLMMMDPQLFADTAEFMVELMTYWAREQIEAGADALWVGDCVASSGFLSPAHYEQFALAGAKRVCDAVREAGAWAIYHAGEPSLPHLQLAAEIEPSMINVGEQIDLARVKEALGDRVCLSGNINPIKLFEAKHLDEVEAETVAVIEAGKPGGGYIFNTGEGVPRTTDPQIIATMMRTAKDHCRYDEGETLDV